MTTETETAVKERPIIMSGEMIRAILDGRKTQTRRVVKPLRGYEDYNVIRPDLAADSWRVWMHGEVEQVGVLVDCPYGKPGSKLWVRETFCENEVSEEPKVFYQADGYIQFPSLRKLKWTPSIFMPRWASRITLEVTGVRVERVQSISEEDAIKEGIEPLFSEKYIQTTVGLEAYRFGEPVPWTNYLWHGRPGGTEGYSSADNAIDSYRSLWQSINEKRGYGWDQNPFVWCISFKVVQP